MPKKLLIINVILLAIAGGSVVFIVRQLMVPMAMPLQTRGRPAPAGRPAAPPAAPLPPAAYAVVASKNLFSPSRTEAPMTQTIAASAAVKPNLYGVVLRDGAPIAYLEDPTTKRVSSYRIGDAVSGGTVQAISADTVTINRPDGKLDIRLRDPGKPRPAGPATAAVPQPPGAQPVGGQPGLPGVIPPAVAPITPTIPPGPVPALPGAPPVINPNAPPVVPGRRPLPPNLLRRLPQANSADAPQQ
jgi:hypothetical protein